MVVSLLARARTNRTTNIVVSLIYLISVAVTIVGETWIYYILGTVTTGGDFETISGSIRPG